MNMKKIIGFPLLEKETGWPRTLLKKLWRQRRITGAKVGYRTTVFDLQKVLSQLEKMEGAVK